jgi:IS30 family transposase
VRLYDGAENAPCSLGIIHDQDSPLASFQRAWTVTRADCRCHLDPRTTCGSGRSEGDLLSGAKNSYIATLVERHSRFSMLIKVRSKETEAVVAALSHHVRKLPATLKRSLTWDRGLEMAKHKDFTVATDVQVYFCDPQSPWQRGTNENTNLLLRQYFPRGTDLSGYSQEQLDQVSLLLNQRPRKTLGFHTPADKLQASVASTT